MTIYKALSPQDERLLNNRIRLLDRPKNINDAPTLPNVQLLPPTADDPGNQLPREQRFLPLDVEIGVFEDAKSESSARINVQLTWNGQAVGSPQTFRTPVPDLDAIFPMKFVVPATDLENPGSFPLGYNQSIGFNEAVPSAPLTINIDTTPPDPVGKVKIPAAVEAELTITKEYLDTVGFVHLSLPTEYIGAKIGDKVEFRYGPSIGTSRVVDTIERLDLSQRVETSKLTSAFIGNVEVAHVIYYRVFDRKGNPSNNSDTLVLDLLLSEPPKNLALDVALHDDDGKILIADAQAPVLVDLAYDNWLANDVLVLSVEGQEPLVETISQVPFPMSLPYKYLHNGNDGVKTVPLTYQVRRGRRSYPTTPISKPLTIDFRKPGLPIDPDNPGTPGDYDPNLQKITVQGTVTPEVNKVRVADLVADVDASVLIHEGFKVGDIVRIYWNGVAIPADPSGTKGKGGVWTVDGTDTAATVLRFTIDPALIRAGGNDADLLVHQVIDHILNENLAVSEFQEVDVRVIATVLPVPEALHTGDDPDDGPTIHCGSIKDDSLIGKVIEVKIPGGESKLANQEISFVYQGFYNVLDDGNNKPGTEISGNTTTVTKRPTQDEADTGFVVKLPYSGVVDVTKDGWCTISYTALIDGHTESAVSATTRVMVQVGGGTCPFFA